MKRKAKTHCILGVALLAVFVLFTLSLRVVDLQPIGPEGSVVAYGRLNQWARDLIGVNMTLYQITDWVSLSVAAVPVGFAAVGLTQWLRRKSIRKVDGGILVLGGLYIAVFAVYGFFEINAINYRPVLIGGVLEPSYPSSTTMLALCILPTAMIRLRRMIGNRRVRNTTNLLCGLLTVFLLVGRLLSGVHWLTDILGGLLFSAAVILLYSAAVILLYSAAENRLK